MNIAGRMIIESKVMIMYSIESSRNVVWKINYNIPLMNKLIAQKGKM